MKYLFIISLLILASCSVEQKCVRKAKYVLKNCPELITADSVIEYMKDSVYITAVQTINDTIFKSDTLNIPGVGQNKVITNTRYINNSFEFKKDGVNIKYKNGVLTYNLRKIIITKTNTLTIKEKLPWWKIGIVCFIIFIVIMIVLVLLK